MRKKMVYALYKGDNFLEMGTAEYLANLLNVGTKFIKFLASPSNLRRIESRNKTNSAMICVRVGLED